jgi:3-oxoacyl-[acyl-carrier protein] reductase
MRIDLTGRRAIVCGSTQGIGRAIAEQLAHAGAAITLVARNSKKLEEVGDSLPGDGHDILAVDFGKPEQLLMIVQEYIKREPLNHILVNNTGGPAPGPVADAETGQFLAAFNQHLVCNHILAQAVLPSMKEAGYGRIINIISTSVRQPLPNLGVSNTIRGAVASWSKTLSREVAPFGITVNNVLPGATRTARLEAIVERNAAKQARSQQEVAHEMQQEIPAGRFAEADEVAYAAVFLASPQAAYITGVSIPVDGGRLLCL